MKHVPITEAKAKFAALVGDAERGETIEITRHGKTVAMLVPANDVSRASDAIRSLREWRKTLPKTGMTIEDILSARDEGRK